MNRKLSTLVCLAAALALFVPALPVAARHSTSKSTGDAKVEGAVYRGTPNPIGGAWVVIKHLGHHPHHHRRAHRAKTNAQGNFSMRIPAGRYVAIATKRGSRAARVYFSVAAGQKMEVKLFLTARVIHLHHTHIPVTVTPANKLPQ